MPNDVSVAAELAKNLTVTFALVIALMGGALEWYVWGRTHRRIVADFERRLDELQREKDVELRKKDAEIEWWQRLTLRATEVADWASRGYADGNLPPLGSGERGHPGGR